VCRGTLAIALLLAGGCATGRPRAGATDIERGTASWYGPGFHGRDTASGERYDMHAMTAAHRTLPFGTIVEVRNLSNGLTTRVRINDRGPFAKNRIIDLSHAAARAIEMIGPGTARVELRVVGTTPSTLAYVVQVGAFQERALAESLYADLLTSYPSVELSSDTVWHRVQLPGFTSRDEAEKVRRALQRAGYTALVIATPRR
jgi:rare lipoprotein A